MKRSSEPTMQPDIDRINDGKKAKGSKPQVLSPPRLINQNTTNTDSLSEAKLDHSRSVVTPGKDNTAVNHPGLSTQLENGLCDIEMGTKKNYASLDEVDGLIKSIVNDFPSKLEQAENQLKILAENMKEMQKRYETQINNLSEMHKSEMMEFTDQNEVQIATLNSEKKEEIKNLCKKYDEDIFEIKSELCSVRQERNELRNEKKQSEEAKADLVAKENQEARDKLNVKVGNQNKTIEFLRHYVSQKEDAVSALTKQVDLEKKENLELITKIKSHEETISALNNEVSKSLTEITSLKNISNNAHESNQSIADLNAKVTELEESLVKKQNKIDGLESSVSSHERMAVVSAKNETCLKDGINQLTKENDALNNDIKGYLQTIVRVQEELTVFKNREDANNQFMNEHVHGNAFETQE